MLALTATIAIPDAGQCLMVAGPVLGFLLLRWIVRHTDEVLNYLFPQWEWERKLGWLNLRAYRQADAFMRGVRHIVHALLAVALYGIVWSVQVIPTFWDGPEAVARGVWKMSVLLVCAGFWAIYLGCDLIPRLSRGHAEEELEKFRAELRAWEEEESESPPGNRNVPALPPPYIAGRPRRGK